MARSRRSSKSDQGPSGPHHFVEAENVRPALALTSTGVYQMVSEATVANASLRASRCAVSGCGKPREDPIHWPSEPEAENNPGELADSEDEWHVPVGPAETEDDVILEPVHSDGTVVLPLHPTDKG
ncbi:MAG: hypothetical protein ABSA21_07745 [Candidatus Limnocylindrales bacterium]